MISITGGGSSDFLSFQILANSEQISCFFSFFSNARFCSRQTYNFVSDESGITLRLLTRKKTVLFTLWLRKRDLFEACSSKSERNI